MNQNVKIKSEWLSTLGYSIYFALLPFDIKFNNFGIGALIILQLPSLFVVGQQQIKNSLITFLKYFYPLIFYYLYLLVSFFIVYNQNPSPQHIETRFGMVCLPLLLSFSCLLRRKNIIIISLSFIFVISLLSFMGIVSYLKYFHLYGEVSTWILANVILVMHRPIWGIYLLGVLILIYYLIIEINVDSKVKKILLPLSVLNLIFLILSQAKNSIIALGIITISGIALSLIKKGKLQRSTVVILTGSSIFLLTLIMMLYFYDERYFFFLSKSISISIEYRFAQWSCAFVNIKQNLFFGVGTGLDSTVLNLCYKSINRKELLGYGTHNQFLSLLLESGIVGFFLVLVWIGKLAKAGLDAQNKSLIYWLVIMLVAMVTENVFSTQKAILILFSILSLILFTNTNRSISKPDHE